tara:strand:- start:636 stop:902 length:267 start_codon:yes stop_codon:yes gene_type:complete
MSKIKKEQLEKIQEQQVRLQTILTDIGVLEVRKHEALHSQAGIYEEISATKKELEDEYGAININVTDGSYTVIEEKDDTELTVVKSTN